MKQYIAVLFVVLTLMSVAGGQISPQFFGMHASTTNPWPTAVGVPFASWRSHDSVVMWSDINTAPGVYDWTRLDYFIQFAEKNGQSVLYTVYYTPSWASSSPNYSCTVNALGGCAPPNDLNPDGTGTDQHLKDFITALMQHEGPGKIQYLEVWNEPNIQAEYTGTIAQIVRMAQDINQVAKSYDPNVKIVSPAETGDGQTAEEAPKATWLGEFLAGGGGQYVDIIGLHGYVLDPECVITRINAALAQMAQYGQSAKPLFVTEGSWSNKLGQFPTDQQPGFAFRHYLSILSTPVQRFYVYAYNNPSEGNLYDEATGQLTTNALVYERFYGWLVGATMTLPCQAQSSGSSIWSCNFTKPNNVKAEVIWDTALPWGQTTTVSVPNQYMRYLDLYGNNYPIQNHQVPVGYDPIVLVVQGAL